MIENIDIATREEPQFVEPPQIRPTEPNQYEVLRGADKCIDTCSLATAQELVHICGEIV